MVKKRCLWSFCAFHQAHSRCSISACGILKETGAQLHSLLLQAALLGTIRPPPHPPAPLPPPPPPPLQDVLADGGAMVEVVEADGDAVPENEGAPVLLFVGAEALLEVLVGLEAAA